MRGVDKILFDLDGGFFGPLYRFAIGFAAIPTMHILGIGSSGWRLAIFLVFVLLLIRIVPALVRKAVRFPPELQEAWAVRRRIAKLYDSYQWRKLTWIGAGLSVYVAVFGPYRPAEIVISMFCLVAGAAATVCWNSVARDSRYPKPTARKIKSGSA